MSQHGFILSAGQSHELEMAMNRKGNGRWTPELIHLLTQGKVLGDIRHLLMGHAKMNMTKHFVDCDAEPEIPQGWTLEGHDQGGEFEWNASKVSLRSLSTNMDSRKMELYKLREEGSLLNVSALHFLLENQEQIPQDWPAGKMIHFWGTTFRDENGCLRVPCLYFSTSTFNPGGGFSGPREWEEYWDVVEKDAEDAKDDLTVIRVR